YPSERVREQRFNQELRLVSQHGGPFSWIGGLYYNTLNSAGNSFELTPGYSQYPVDTGAGGMLRPDELEYYSVGHTELEERAVYAELSYDLTEKWQVTVGARYYDYDLRTRDATDLPLLGTTLVGDRGPDDILLDYEFGGQKDDGSLFKFNTSYQFTDDVMMFATVSEGFRIGNSNGVPLCDASAGGQQNVCAQPAEFEYFADSTTNYEVGLRT